MRLFPLLLGLALAAIVILAARRRRELGLLLHLLIEGGKGRGLSEWYFLRSRWGLGIGPSGRGRADTLRAAWLRILAPAAAALVWIGLAAVQLRGVETAPRLWTTTAVGALAFLLAARRPAFRRPAFRRPASRRPAFRRPASRPRAGKPRNKRRSATCSTDIP